MTAHHVAAAQGQDVAIALLHDGGADIEAKTNVSRLIISTNFINMYNMLRKRYSVEAFLTVRT